MAFVDNHNAGYYINSYTTKLNPTLDNVLRRLLDSVRRLQSEWQEKEAAKKHHNSASQDNVERSDARKENFRRTMQVLSRFESSFRRASWKSGCEMAFPILFGHLSFTTHRCWTVYMRKASQTHIVRIKSAQIFSDISEISFQIFQKLHFRFPDISFPFLYGF
jgi:hypothetical protein